MLTSSNKLTATDVSTTCAVEAISRWRQKWHHTGCGNVSHYQQQSHSGLHSPGRINLCPVLSNFHLEEISSTQFAWRSTCNLCRIMTLIDNIVHGSGCALKNKAVQSRVTVNISPVLSQFSASLYKLVKIVIILWGVQECFAQHGNFQIWYFNFPYPEENAEGMLLSVLERTMKGRVPQIIFSSASKNNWTYPSLLSILVAKVRRRQTVNVSD